MQTLCLAELNLKPVCGCKILFADLDLEIGLDIQIAKLEKEGIVILTIDYHDFSRNCTLKYKKKN